MLSLETDTFSLCVSVFFCKTLEATKTIFQLLLFRNKGWKQKCPLLQMLSFSHRNIQNCFWDWQDISFFYGTLCIFLGEFCNFFLNTCMCAKFVHFQLKYMNNLNLHWIPFFRNVSNLSLFSLIYFNFELKIPLSNKNSRIKQSNTDSTLKTVITRIKLATFLNVERLKANTHIWFILITFIKIYMFLRGFVFVFFYLIRVIKVEYVWRYIFFHWQYF